MKMIVPIGTSHRVMRELSLQGFVCPNCSQTMGLVLGKTIDKVTVFFIPIVYVTTPFIECPRCSKKYNIKKDLYKGIKSGTVAFDSVQSSLMQMYEADQQYQWRLNEAAKARAIEYSKRSRKKVWIAALLSFFFGIVGAQNWYLGHKKRALAAIIIFIAGFATIFLGPFIAAACWGFNVYWGFGDAIRIAIGRAKDSDGMYVMTNGQYNTRCGIKIL